MIENSPYGRQLAARLEELWAKSTNWHRRLWSMGAVAAIGELVEASESLPVDAIRDLQADVIRIVGPDPGLGDAGTRTALRKALKGELVYGRASWHELRHLLEIGEEGYLRRWSDVLREPASRPGVERASRAIAGHLVQVGFAPSYLHRWLRYQVRYRAETLTIGDLVEEAGGLAQQPEREFTVIVPVMSAPEVGVQAPAEWVSAQEAAAFIENAEGKRASIRQSGAFRLTVNARDPYGAVERARDLVDRWDARVELATGKRMVRLDKAWVDGVPFGISLEQSRRMKIGALARQRRIYAPLVQSETAVRIDDALQLAQPMVAGPRSSAISGGWAAIEALLTEDGEPERLASPRLASIVACSFPRAELTTLAFAHRQRANDGLAAAINEAGGNLERARLVADAIVNEQPVVGRGPEDEAACERMRELLAEPKKTLARVRDYVTICLNRLYRQRNLTLHGGRVGGDGRLVALASAPPLVGAGLDRIVHAWFTEETSPVVLVARANLSLELVGSQGGRHPTELLEA